MKKLPALVLALLFLLAVVSCKKTKNDQIPTFSLNDTGYVKFHIRNCTKPVNFRLVYWSFLPFGQAHSTMYFQKDSIYLYKFVSTHPATFNGWISGPSICFLGLPKDTITIFIDLDSTKRFPQGVTYKGNTSHISNYLTYI